MPTLYATFHDVNKAQQAVRALVERGALDSDISLFVDESHAHHGFLDGLKSMASVVIRGIGMVIGEGSAASVLSETVDSHDGLAEFLVAQGLSAEVAQAYEEISQNGGGVLALRLPSGSCDEATGRSILESCQVSSEPHQVAEPPR